MYFFLSFFLSVAMATRIMMKSKFRTLMLLMKFCKNLVSSFGGGDFLSIFFSFFSFGCHGNQNNDKIKILFHIVCSPYPTY